MPDSSITTSLALLERCARERADQQQRELELTARRRRVERLVKERDQRRAERARDEAKAERLRRERIEAQREAARRDGIRQGEKVRVEVAARHEAEMQLMAMRHQQALAAERPAERRSSRRPWLMSLAAGLALAAGALWGGPPAVEASSWLTTTANAHAEVATIAAAQHALVEENAALSEELALASVSPEPEVSAPSKPTPPPYRGQASWTPPRPKTPPPARVCDDGIGDPCCAFGEIVC